MLKFQNDSTLVLAYFTSQVQIMNFKTVMKCFVMKVINVVMNKKLVGFIKIYLCKKLETEISEDWKA